MRRFLLSIAAMAAMLSLCALATPAAAWDAGNDNGVKDCTHDACSVGVITSSWIATDAAYGRSQFPGNRCRPGTEHYGGFCYKACPSNYHRTAVCSGKRNGSHPLDVTAIDTYCAKYGSTNRIPDKVCNAGYHYWGGLCYT